MSEENKPQIIIHKSNWAKQLIIAVVVLVFFFFAIGKNPSKSDFIQGCVKEYLKKEQSFGSSTSNYVSEITTGIFGSWFEPLIERDDYVIFSKFNVEIDNDEFKMKIKAFGFWGNIYFSEGIMERKEPVQSEMERDERKNNGCPGFEKFKQEVELAYDGAENVDVNKFGTFDYNNCKGSYDGATYFWDGDNWNSLE
jgi:hypothetical protein